ncbi:MAG: hypothetical protein U9O53_00670 [archaeon]|nr:hypothetical protein [archaeon]
MITEIQILMLAATAIVFALISLGVMESNRPPHVEDKKEKKQGSGNAPGSAYVTPATTPATHGHHPFNQLYANKQTSQDDIDKKRPHNPIPDPHAVDKVMDIMGSHYTPKKEDVDALVEAYTKKHGDDNGVSNIRTAAETYLKKKHFGLSASSS